MKKDLKQIARYLKTITIRLTNQDFQLFHFDETEDYINIHSANAYIDTNSKTETPHERLNQS